MKRNRDFQNNNKSKQVKISDYINKNNNIRPESINAGENPETDNILENVVENNNQVVVACAERCQNAKAVPNLQNILNIDRKNLEDFLMDGKRYVRCILCVNDPVTVQLYSKNKKPAPITTQKGTGYRNDVIENHIRSDCHLACMNAARTKTITDFTKSTAPLDVIISKSNEKQANHIGKLMIQIFTDAKILTLSARNWPARYVSNEASNRFDFNQGSSKMIPDNLSLSYVNPVKHLDIMKCIVAADRKNVQSLLKSALALSLRIDGSIDRSHKDKIYVLGKVITHSGESILLFLGVGEQKKGGAAGLLETALHAMFEMFSEEFVREHILSLISSIVTDGASINRGEENGLWMLLETEIAKAGSHIPLLKVWCVAHRSNLAFNDLSKNNADVMKMIDILNSISSFFHHSYVRMNGLIEIANQNELKYLTLPHFFVIRWVEFTFQLFNAVLTSWNALVLYFNEESDVRSRGFRNYLTNLDNLKRIAFMGDLLRIFKHFQKKIQADSLTLPSFCEETRIVKSSLTDLKENAIPGGFESALINDVIVCQNSNSLNGIELNVGLRSRTAEQPIENFRSKVLDSLIDYLDERMGIASQDLSLFESFIKLEKSIDLGKVHELVGKDLDLASFCVQYNDLANARREIKDLSPSNLLKYLAENNRIDHFREMAVILARILACTPHSADTERCISANNNLKTNKRISLAISTESNYLYVHFNLPVLENWDPRPAVVQWLKETSRRVSTVSSNSKKSNEQSYFKHIFEAATYTIDSDSTKERSAFHF